tara:strand:+ start:153 stop:449 length:297 start_codon:yes stop_codon:yes gene_type:complete
MNHEQIIKRDDGTRVSIAVRFWINATRPEYDIYVYICNKGKRTYRHCFDMDGWEYRSLSMEDRRAYTQNEYLKFVSQEEINTAKLAAWQLLNPLKVNK